MVTFGQLRHLLHDSESDQHAPVLVAVYDQDGVGRVLEVEDMSTNNGHLQLDVTFGRRVAHRRVCPPRPVEGGNG